MDCGGFSVRLWFAGEGNLCFRARVRLAFSRRLRAANKAEKRVESLGMLWFWREFEKGFLWICWVWSSIQCAACVDTRVRQVGYLPAFSVQWLAILRLQAEESGGSGRLDSIGTVGVFYCFPFPGESVGGLQFLSSVPKDFQHAALPLKDAQ